MNNNLNYQRQSKMKSNIDSQKQIYNNSNNNPVNNEQKQPYGPMPSRIVKPEDYKYDAKGKALDASFTHSNINFGKEILEEYGVDQEDVEIEKMQEEVVDDTDKYEKKPSKKRAIIMKIILIGIVLELLVIGIVSIYKYVTSSKVVNTLSCISNTIDETNKLTIETENIYYFKKKGAYKKEVITKYAFDTKEGFDNYKKNYVDTGIYDISGLSYENSFNTLSLTYTSRILYEYSKMQKDEKNTSNSDDKILIKDKQGNELVNIDILDMDGTIKSNEEQGFTCSIKK